LSDRHYIELSIGSGLADDIILLAGFRTLDGTPENRQFLYERGYRGEQLELLPLLYCPFFDTEGVEFSQIKSDHPRLDEVGKPIKYETPCVGGYGVACCPNQLEMLLDPSVPIWITEGLKKAAALWQHGLCAIGLAGVWMHRIGEKTDPTRPLLPGLARLPFSGRRMIIAYDSDSLSKESVYLADLNIAAELSAVGAQVQFTVLPHKPDGSKMGVDDFLLTHSMEDLLACVVDTLPQANFDNPDATRFEAETERFNAIAETRKRARREGDFPKFRKNGTGKDVCLPETFSIALGRATVEVTRAICAAEHADSLSLADWKRLKQDALACQSASKSFNAYLLGRVFNLFCAKVPHSEKTQDARTYFGKAYHAMKNLGTVASAYTDATWMADAPVDFNAALKDQSPEVRQAYHQEWRNRRFEKGNQLTAKEVRQRLGLTAPRQRTPLQRCRRFSDAFLIALNTAADQLGEQPIEQPVMHLLTELMYTDHAQVYGKRDEAVPHPVSTLAPDGLFTEEDDGEEDAWPSWDDALALDRAAEAAENDEPPSEPEETPPQTLLPIIEEERKEPPSPFPSEDYPLVTKEALIALAERGALPTGAIQLAPHLTALDLNNVVLKARDFRDDFTLSLCLAVWKARARSDPLSPAGRTFLQAEVSS
jgi:hypothetical protein